MAENQYKFGLLLVDDDLHIIKILKRAFKNEPYEVFTADSGEKALTILSSETVDAALVDIRMPGMDGITLLDQIKQYHPEVTVVMLTGNAEIKDAVRAIKLGAVDFLEKPFSVQGIRARIDHLYRIWSLKAENNHLRRQLQFRFGFDRLVGNSPPMIDLKRLILHVGPADVAVLIQGETGTGKELVARAVHVHSNRAQGPFVPVDCATINDSIIESELFGHMKGAFTGAQGATMGLIRSADKGTLFLDEIGELAPAMQAKLLRTLQEGEVRPVGSSRRYQVDIRVVAATNRDLAREVEGGTFRQDLFYRLNVVSMNLPPLRRRSDDIALLARYFIKRFNTDISPVRDIGPEAMDCLQRYRWPGNVRELENVIRRAIALGGNEFIQPENLDDVVRGSMAEGTDVSAMNPDDDSMAAYERLAIRNALRKCHSNRRAAAELLQIGEATLYRKLKKYRIDV